MQDTDIQVIDYKIDKENAVVSTKWRFSCTLDLPWKPNLAASGGTEHFFNQNGRMIKHVESWNIGELRKIVKTSAAANNLTLCLQILLLHSGNWSSLEEKNNAVLQETCTIYSIFHLPHIWFVCTLMVYTSLPILCLFVFLYVYDMPCSFCFRLSS